MSTLKDWLDEPASPEWKEGLIIGAAIAFMALGGMALLATLILK